MINSIRRQPASTSLMAAYRSLSFEVQAQATDLSAVPPVVYCDIYLDTVFYKTVSKTVPYGYVSGASIWRFDIQDAVQEWMEKSIATPNGIDLHFPPKNATECFVKFRASATVGGLIVPEGAVPVQGTLLTAPVPGGGLTSNTFTVINATLQLNEPQDLATYLEMQKPGIWKPGCYPLTTRPDVTYVGLNHSDYYPMFVVGTLRNVRIAYKYNGEMDLRREMRAVVARTTTGSVVYVPCGAGNLAALFTSINFFDVSSYWVELLGDDDDTILGTTSVYYPRVCSEDDVRIHFINALGSFDAITFKVASIEGEIKSETWQKAITDPFDQSAHGISRFNVRSNRTYTAKTVDYPEMAMEWMEELFRSPVAYMQTNLGYIPIVIQDAKFPSIKEEERYNYEVSLQFKLSHEFINIRN